MLSRRRYAHLEADHIGLGVVVLGVTFQSEAHSGQAVCFGVAPAGRPVDAQGRDTLCPVGRLGRHRKAQPEDAVNLALLVELSRSAEGS